MVESLPSVLMCRCRVLFGWGAVYLLSVCTVALQGAEKPQNDASGNQPSVKFVLSESERLRLDNLRLRQQVLQLQAALLQKDTEEYVLKTLHDHGSPTDVRFDGRRFEFVTELPRAVK
jgi:hypothetical protein